MATGWTFTARKCANPECDIDLTPEQCRRGRRYHSKACYMSSPERSEQASRINIERWQQWKKAGIIPPTHTPQARLRRGASRSVANRKRSLHQRVAELERKLDIVLKSLVE